MEELEHIARATDPLFSCSICRCMLQEAVLLKCLHNCCRQCFSTAAEADGCHERMSCGLCGAVTLVGNEQPNGFINSRVMRYRMIAETRTCGKCRENGECDKPAMVWCPGCLHSLCGDCIGAHKQYFRQHVTQSLEELTSLDEVCSKLPAATCRIHGKPLDIVCLNCDEAKCINCWASCKEKKHEVHSISEESFDRYVGSLISGISSIESELLRKSSVLEWPKIALRDMKAARHRHLEDLNLRKRRVVDAVEEAYKKMAHYTKDAYDDLQAEGMAAAKAAERIASDLSDAQGYIRRLVDSNEKCEMFKQQKMLRERLSVLSAELDNLSERLDTTTKELNIEATLPENVDDVVRAWIGTPRTYSASSSTRENTGCQIMNVPLSSGAVAGADLLMKASEDSTHMNDNSPEALRRFKLSFDTMMIRLNSEIMLSSYYMSNNDLIVHPMMPDDAENLERRLHDLLVQKGVGRVVNVVVERYQVAAKSCHMLSNGNGEYNLGMYISEEGAVHWLSIAHGVVQRDKTKLWHEASATNSLHTGEFNISFCSQQLKESGSYNQISMPTPYVCFAMNKAGLRLSNDELLLHGVDIMVGPTTLVFQDSLGTCIPMMTLSDQRIVKSSNSLKWINVNIKKLPLEPRDNGVLFNAEVLSNQSLESYSWVNDKVLKGRVKFVSRSMQYVFDEGDQDYKFLMNAIFIQCEGDNSPELGDSGSVWILREGINASSNSNSSIEQYRIEEPERDQRDSTISCQAVDETVVNNKFKCEAVAVTVAIFNHKNEGSFWVAAPLCSSLYALRDTFKRKFPARRNPGEFLGVGMFMP